uniref:Uncharacterized protein n=1 Tax=Aegilops tauschii subsp. strangulata TaxID=200361 RepID=A0A453DNW8_AEGTS
PEQWRRYGRTGNERMGTPLSCSIWPIEVRVVFSFLGGFRHHNFFFFSSFSFASGSERPAAG